MFLFASAQKICLRYLKFCFKLEILIYLFFFVSFISNIFKQKVVFPAKKAPAVESVTQFCSEADKAKGSKVLKENSIVLLLKVEEYKRILKLR